MRALVLAVALCAGLPASAQDQALAVDANETVLRLPTEVKLLNGETHRGSMTLTQYKPNGDGPFPIALIMHGRAVKESDRMARQRYLQAARYFVRRGFMVIVPTRLGYGEGNTRPDPENSGGCVNKRYAPSFEAAATEGIDALRYAQSQPFADPKRIVVVGQSVGGMSTIALAAKMPAGLLGAVNFAGGAGGDPDVHPGMPCEAPKLGELYSHYGKTTRVPTMWVYSKNDKFFGPPLPAQWFAAYKDNGGTGEFRAMPAFGENGHALFGFGFAVWRPLMDDFLASLGFELPRSTGVPKASGFAELDDVDSVPVSTGNAREGYRKFLVSDVPRAYAVASNGAWSWSSSLDAVPRALAACKKNANADCKLYAVDDNVVWKE